LRRYDLNLVLSLHALLHTRNVTQAVLLPALAVRLPLEAPHVSISARGLSGLTTDPVAATESSEVDLSIGAFQTFPASCTEVLYTDRWMCAVSADHPDVGDRMSIELRLREIMRSIARDL
jgi:hypothetical protein